VPPLFNLSAATQQSGLIVVAATGAIAGAVHVLSGPDHLSAVAPLAIRGGKRSWVAGLRWGLGHVAGVLLVGAIAMALRGFIPVERLSGWSEWLVGVVLIGIGLWGLHKAFGRGIHLHRHEHEGREHAHLHLHGPGTEHAEPKAHVHMHAAFGVGILHGLAGSSHLLGVLPALALPFVDGAAYMGAFAIGTITAMVGFAWAMGAVSVRAASRGDGLYRGVMAVAGTAAICVGVFWLR